jgi:hypothetical protein
LLKREEAKRIRKFGQISSVARVGEDRFLTQTKSCRSLSAMLRAIHQNGRDLRPRPTEEEQLCAERHYSVNELSALWNLSKQTIRRIFEDEPDVVRMGEGEGHRKRKYVTLRIPESVVRRVYQRLSQRWSKSA